MRKVLVPEVREMVPLLEKATESTFMIRLVWKGTAVPFAPVFASETCTGVLAVPISVPEAFRRLVKTARFAVNCTAPDWPEVKALLVAVV